MLKQTPLARAALFFLVLSAPACAAEYKVGDAIEKNDLVIEPHYLTGIETGRMPDMAAADDVIHLELDVHAAKNEPHGFKEKDWIPYLTIVYTLEKIPVEAVAPDKPIKPYHKSGRLFPMVATDGPHYAANVLMAGPGRYHIAYHFEPPSKMGLLRHTDAATGVPDWWPPFSLEWDFDYLGKAGEGITSAPSRP